MSRVLSYRAPASIEPLLAAAAGVLVCAMPLTFLIGRSVVDIALSLTAILFLARCALARDWSWLRTPWIVVAVAVWAYLMLDALGAAHREDAVSRAVPWIRFVVFAAALQFWVLADAQWRKRLLLVTAAIVFLVALDTFYQLLVGKDVFGIPQFRKDRLTGPIADTPPKVGTYIMHFLFPVVMPVVAWAAARRGTWLPKAAAVAAVCFGVTVVQVTGERMAFLLTLLGLGATGLLVRGAKRMMAAAVVVAAIAVLGLFLFNQTVFERQYQLSVDNIVGFEETPYGMIFRSATNIVEQHPWFGIGPKNFRHICPDEAYGWGPDVVYRCGLHPHNMYMEWLTETGIIGLVGFLALIALWARHFAAGAGRWRDDPTAVGLVVAVFIFLWPIASTQSIFSNWNAGMFWLILGWALALTSPAATERPPAAA